METKIFHWEGVIAPSHVVHLLRNLLQSTALDELSSVMCLP
jgi:hypothetical protein